MLHPSEAVLSNFFQLLKQAASMLHPFKWMRCVVTLQFGTQQSEIGLAGHCQEWEGLPSFQCLLEDVMVWILVSSQNSCVATYTQGGGVGKWDPSNGDLSSYPGAPLHSCVRMQQEDASSREEVSCQMTDPLMPRVGGF